MLGRPFPRASGRFFVSPAPCPEKVAALVSLHGMLSCYPFAFRSCLSLLLHLQINFCSRLREVIPCSPPQSRARNILLSPLYWGCGLGRRVLSTC